MLSPAKSTSGDDAEDFAEWEMEFLQMGLLACESPEVTSSDAMATTDDEPMADIDPYLCSSPAMRKTVGSPLGSLTFDALAKARCCWVQLVSTIFNYEQTQYQLTLGFIRDECYDWF